MPKIHFVSSPKIPHDKVEEWKGYILGSVHDVSEDECDRWLRRGVAEVVSAKEARAITFEENKVEPEPTKAEPALVPTPVEVKPENKVVELSTVSSSGTVSSQGKH